MDYWLGINNMKIGDKVRFLSETGGGRISGFKGNNIVLVEDEDGFEIPTPVNEVVVVEDDDYSMKHLVETKKSKESSEPDTRSIRQRLSASENVDEAEDEEEDEAIEDPSVNFTPKPRERQGGDTLSVYLAFVPKDIKQLLSTKFEMYIINDSNYFLSYTLLSAEGNSWNLKSKGELEPNTKIFISEAGTSDINAMEHVAVQAIAYKSEKGFLLKPAVDVQFRIDPVRFCKLHAFTSNDFFDDDALLFTVIENDRPARPLVVDAETLKREMYASAGPKLQPGDKKPARAAGGEKPVATVKGGGAEPIQPLVRRYDSSQSKSHKVKQIMRNDKIVVDLHANELLDTTAGMSSGDILEYQLDVFRKTLEQYKSHPGQKIIFIHGKGEGVLRHAIIHELNYRYKKYQYQDASFQEYGYGATQVTIK